MKIKTTKTELFNKLKVVSKVVKHNHHQPSFTAFMIDTINANTIKITGTDESGRIETSLGCEIENFKEMKFLVNAKTFMDGLKNLPHTPIEMVVHEGKILVLYHVGKFELPTQDAGAFPEPYSTEKNTLFNINHALLLDGFSSTMKFVSTEELRPIMNSVNVQHKEGKLSFAGSNGAVLGVYEVEDKALDLPELNVNIPGRAAQVVSDIIQSNAKIVTPVSYNHNNITFVIDGYTITFRLHEGRYPNIWSVIPRNPGRKVDVRRSELISAIGRVSVFSSDTNSLVKFSTKDSSLTLVSEDLDFRHGATETVDLDQECDEMTIGFKSSLLESVLKTIEEETCEFHLTSPERPAILKGKGNENATFIVMPMQIN